MKKILLVCVALLTLAVIGCTSLKSSSIYSGLPQCAVNYSEKYGLGDGIVSVAHEVNHSMLYTMGFDEPKRGWTVMMSDSTQIVFSEKGEWVYSVIHYNRADLAPQYLSPIENVDRMLLMLQNMVGKEMRVVGVSKGKNMWIIAAYKTHDSYIGPPRYYYFEKDGSYWGSKIIV